MDRHLTATLMILSLGLGFLTFPAAAWERGFGIMKHGGGGWGPPAWKPPVGRPPIGRHPRKRPFLRGFGRGSDVNVVVQQIFAPPPPPSTVFQGPTVLDQPVELGIREARPAQPVIFVLNEGESRAMASGDRPSMGPKIIERMDEGWPEPEPSFSAKIIHLTVPVGGRP